MPASFAAIKILIKSYLKLGKGRGNLRNYKNTIVHTGLKLFLNEHSFSKNLNYYLNGIIICQYSVLIFVCYWLKTVGWIKTYLYKKFTNFLIKSYQIRSHLNKLKFLLPGTEKMMLGGICWEHCVQYISILKSKQ